MSGCTGARRRSVSLWAAVDEQSSRRINHLAGLAEGVTVPPAAASATSGTLSCPPPLLAASPRPGPWRRCSAHGRRLRCHTTRGEPCRLCLPGVQSYCRFSVVLRMGSPLPGWLITNGETIAQVLVNVEDALLAVIEAYKDLGPALPPALPRFSLYS